MELGVTQTNDSGVGNYSATRTKRFAYGGIEKTVKLLVKLKNQFSKDADIRALAMRITESNTPDYSGLPNRRLSALSAFSVFSWLAKNIRYSMDPVAFENIQTPHATLNLKSGDCEDLSLLAGSLLESIGVETRFVLAAEPAQKYYSHIYLQYFDNKAATWKGFDLTLDGAALNREPENAGKKAVVTENGSIQQLGAFPAVVAAITAGAGKVADVINGGDAKRERTAQKYLEAQAIAAENKAQMAKYGLTAVGIASITALSVFIINKYV